MKGKKVPGRPRTMMFDWMKNKDRGYKEVKEKAKNREELPFFSVGDPLESRTCLKRQRTKEEEEEELPNVQV